MSLIAYAFGGALEGAGKGLAKVGEHRRRMEGERLREAFWEKQNELKMQQQSDLAGEEREHRETLAKDNRTHQAALVSYRLGTQADWRKEDIAQRKEEGEKNRGLRQQEIDLREKDLETQKKRWDAQLAAVRSKARAKQAADEAEVKRNERKAEKEWVEKRLTVTDENTGEKKLDLPTFDYWMNYLDTYKRLPYQVPASWADINRLAETENIPLEDVRDRLEQRGHPVPIGDPPPYLTNQGGRLWPGRNRYSPR